MDSADRKIKVMVVDDSAVMRKMIPTLLEKDGEIEVVATAIDGDFAISKMEQYRPDVVTLDVDMPRMDGIATLGVIVSKHKVPVLMLSALTTQDAALTLKALEMGAFDFICKPQGSNRVSEMGDELVSKIKAAARSRMVQPTSPIEFPKAVKRKPPILNSTTAEKVVAIGASSGGPNALRRLLPRLPGDFEAGILIVQHMPENFTSVMSRWLDEICEIEVREARDGDAVTPGLALVAPGAAHMRIKRTAAGAIVELDKSGPVNGHMPSVDVLFQSVARECGAQATAVIMTGMGSDGAEGIGEIQRCGGMTLAQDRESCAIFGMPRSAIDRGYIQRIAPLDDLAPWLINLVGRTHISEVQ